MTPEVDSRTLRLFAQVSEVIERATWALLQGDAELAREVVAADEDVDNEVAQVEQLVWSELEGSPALSDDLRHGFALLMVVSELERSADLAEHVAQRALDGVGTQMTPAARGIVQRMSEAAAEIWQEAADTYAERRCDGEGIHETDEELDILHQRLTGEVATGSMPPAVAQEVTLLARFYERLGDHAVNIGRRLAELPAPDGR